MKSILALTALLLAAVQAMQAQQPVLRTVDASLPYAPLRVQQKFGVATRDTLGGPSILYSGIFAGVSQLNNDEPSFGQGAEGFAKRFGAGVLDRSVGNFAIEAALPSLLHQDPRYFRRGTGSMKGRIYYALTRVAVTRADDGHTVWNGSEILGAGVNAGLGNLYHEDLRGASPTMQRMFSRIGTDALSNLFREIGPDIRRKLFHK